MTTQERQQDIDKIRRLPGQIEALVSGLSAAQLTTHFLASEWTVAQNVHHLADSHMNSYIRCKLILTEEKPPLKPYDQDAWANLPDAQSADLSASLLLLAQRQDSAADRVCEQSVSKLTHNTTTRVQLLNDRRTATHHPGTGT